MGLFILVAQGNPQSIFSQAPNYGDALIFIASVSYALMCIVEPMDLALSLWQSLYMQSVWSVFLYVPIFILAPSSNLIINMQNIPLYFICRHNRSVIAPLLWMQGVASLGPARASAFMNLFPLIQPLWLLEFCRKKFIFIT